MKKIPTIFERDWDGDRSRVLNKPNPVAQWVFDGEGATTRKYDGVACMFDGKKWFKRREIKAKDGVLKMPDGEFISIGTDAETGNVVGWIPIGDGPEDKYMQAALIHGYHTTGTYEFLGPKSQGNVEEWPDHVMFLHAAADEYYDVPRDFDGIKSWLEDKDIEGLVWHHDDGRMAKIKKRDFGLKRKPVVKV